MADSKKKKRKKKNPVASFFFTLAILACIGIMGFSAYKLVSTWLEYRAGDEEYDNLRAYTVAQPPAEEPEEEPVEVEVVDEDDARSRRKPPIDVDWAALKKINEDIVGWIYIGAVDISYPVVQGPDNDYYLHRTFERQDNFAGAIFVEAENASDFLDPNTIVYGHNMNNGSMFGRLKNLSNEEKYKDDPYFWILTPKGNYRYRMFSLHVTGVTSEVYTLFKGVDKKFIDWCESMQSASSVEIQKETFNLHSRIVTLSTCTGDDTTRYVVQGIAVRE